MAKDKKDLQPYEHKGKRKNIPEVGLVSSATDKVASSKKYQFDPYLDPQLIWSSKVEKNELSVDIVSLHVHERIDPKTLIDKLKLKLENDEPKQLNFFDNPDFERPLNKALQFYQHEEDWSNRLIAGDSLLIMNSLLQKEGMGEKIQMIFMDPPYGINYKSNFQPFTNNKDVKDNDDNSIPHEPEMIRAFRDTWELGIHSYLSHLRDRVLLSHELLTDSGSFILQISDINLHHCREILDEIFGVENFFGMICFQKVASPLSAENSMPSKLDFLLWYAKDKSKIKYHKLYFKRKDDIDVGYNWIELQDGSRRKLTEEEKSGEQSLPKGKLFKPIDLFKSGPGSKFDIEVEGKVYNSGNKWWGQTKEDIQKLVDLKRVIPYGNSLTFIRYLEDFPYKQMDNLWDGLAGARDKIYVVQTNEEILKRCILMTTDVGDITFDPTCGSGTTAIASERLGRKWITCDSSRVALNLARKRIMTEVYDYYKLQNPNEGISGGIQYKEVDRLTPSLIAKGHSGKKETIYLEPTIDRQLKRVSGPFTVEAVPSVRVKGPDEEPFSKTVDQSIDNYIAEIKSTGIKTFKGEKISFINVEKTKGYQFIHAQGQTIINDVLKNAYITFGPDYAPMEQTQVENAVHELREISKENCLLVFCSFHFDPEASKDIDELKLPNIDFLKSQMSVDLLTGDLRKKRSSNQSFWLIGQPDVEIKKVNSEFVVKINGFDYYNPSIGSIESKGSENIALWMLDTNYDGRSICPDQFFFPIEDKNDWTKLKKSLKDEIDVDKIVFFQGIESAPFKKGPHNKIAVKIVDNRGIESLVVKDLL